MKIVNLKRRFNTNFRQTRRSINSDNQTKIYYHINRNIPQRIYLYTKDKFKTQIQNINRMRVSNALSKNRFLKNKTFK